MWSTIKYVGLWAIFQTVCLVVAFKIFNSVIIAILPAALFPIFAIPLLTKKGGWSYGSKKRDAQKR